MFIFSFHSLVLLLSCQASLLPPSQSRRGEKRVSYTGGEGFVPFSKENSGMYKIVKATLLLKKTVRKRVADREYSKNTIYLQNVPTYKIFSPKILHAMLLNER